MFKINIDTTILRELREKVNEEKIFHTIGV